MHSRPDELQNRLRALKEAIERHNAKKADWPTVAPPRSGFKRLPKVS